MRGAMRKACLAAVAVTAMAAPAAAGGLVSNLDGTAVETTTVMCSPKCNTVKARMVVSGDEMIWTGAFGRRVYRLGPNTLTDHTAQVDIVGRTLTFAVDTNGYRSTTRLTLSGRTCSVSSSGSARPTSETCTVLAGGPARPAEPELPGKPPRDLVDSRCYRLDVVQTKEQCGTKYQFWHDNTLTPTNAHGCPGSFRFTYQKPDGTEASGRAGDSFRTCGGRPRNVHASVRP